MQKITGLATDLCTPESYLPARKNVRDAAEALNVNNYCSVVGLACTRFVRVPAHHHLTISPPNPLAILSTLANPISLTIRTILIDLTPPSPSAA